MNKIAIITGASAGIGKATAKLFLEQNWQVINISRRAAELKNIINIKADFTEQDWPTQIQISWQSLLQQPSQIALIHNAFFYVKDSIMSMTSENFRDVLEVSLVAPARLNTLILPYMNKGSSIIYLGSTLSEKAVPQAASYVISKHALIGMMRASCQDLAEKQIHSCCVCPGFTDTEMLRQHLQQDEQILAAIKNKVTFKRLINPEEIARLIYFCVENPVINGSVLHANLGQIES